MSKNKSNKWSWKNVVRMYAFVKYLVQLFGVALFWDASNTVYRINSCKHNLERSSDQFRENTESNDHWINSVKQQNHMIIGWIPWQRRIKWWSDQFRGNTQSDDHQVNVVERQTQVVIGSIPWKHRIKCSSDQFRRNTESHGHRIGSVETQNQMIIWSIPWKHELSYVSQRKT